MFSSRFKAVLLVTAAALVLHAADTTGSIQGTVVDPSAAALPGVQLELTNQTTNVLLVQKSDPSGHFVFNMVPPGTYSLRATAEGFRPSVAGNLQVEVNKTTRVDISMQMGVVSESIEVVA